MKVQCAVLSRLDHVPQPLLSLRHRFLYQYSFLKFVATRDSAFRVEEIWWQSGFLNNSIAHLEARLGVFSSSHEVKQVLSDVVQFKKM